VRFLVQSRMINPPGDEVFALFPAEQARVGELLQSGALEQLYVASDFRQAWLIVNGESEAAAHEIALSLPLARFSEREVIALLDIS
jgi:hypothetical protein